MKKLILSLLIISSLFFFGCATYDKVVIDNLTARIEKLEKKSILGLAEKAGANFYPARGIDGDTAGTLDHIDGAGLADNDVAFVVVQNDASYGDSLLVYVLDADSAETEAIPFVVSPQSNAGDKRWILVGSGHAPEVVASGAKTLSTAEARSGYIMQTAAGTIAIPKASTVGYGTAMCIVVRDASETCVINPDDADIIFLPGTGALSAGDSISSPGAAGDFVCMVATSAVVSAGTDGWWIFGYSGTWTDTN